jgi:hypothetical protein
MISIVVKFNVRPDCSDEWIERINDFTLATREEAGNLWFEWSRSVENPDSSFLSKGFSMLMPALHTSTLSTSKNPYGRRHHAGQYPEILYAEIPRTEWSLLAEMSVAESGSTWRSLCPNR